MKLFVNNKRIKLVKRSKSIKDHDYDFLINAIDHIDLNKVQGKILITGASLDQLLSFIKALELKKLDKVKCFSFLVDDIEVAEKAIKKQFKIVKAAGGIVAKDDKVLLIHRLGTWDFPKGKLENNELAREGALREVEEECGVKAEIVEKICSTWHTYTDKDKKILKKTTWYHMRCLNDSKLKPQVEEQIDKIEYMNLEEAKAALKDSYQSIRYVFKKFKKNVSVE